MSDNITLPRKVIERLVASWGRDTDGFYGSMDFLRAALAAPSEDIETLRRDAFRKGFYAGFAATGEGWNGEYPFQDMNRPIVGNPSVEAAIDEAMQEDKT